MIIAQLSISPVGEDVSLHKYVKIVIEVIKKYNVKFEINAMSTVIETDKIENLFNIISESNDKLVELGVKRVITELKIDNRIDKDATIESKLRHIKK